MMNAQRQDLHTLNTQPRNMITFRAPPQQRSECHGCSSTCSKFRPLCSGAQAATEMQFGFGLRRVEWRRCRRRKQAMKAGAGKGRPILWRIFESGDWKRRVEPRVCQPCRPRRPSRISFTGFDDQVSLQSAGGSRRGQLYA